MKTLNEAFCTPSMRRRYEVWFLRLGLADGSGAWWFRYLLMNPGRGGCPGNPQGMPVQVWASWFPHGEKPQSFIQGFAWEGLQVSGKGQSPFHFQVADNAIDELEIVDAHAQCPASHARSTGANLLDGDGTRLFNSESGRSPEVRARGDIC